MLSKNIKTLRKSKGLSQDELAVKKNTAHLVNFQKQSENISSTTIMKELKQKQNGCPPVKYRETSIR